jgi:serine/threonine-protein phosphatase 2B catalytic subunit
MLRGNHESRAMTEHFTFRSEILQKFQEEEIYELFIETFEAMPIAADVNGDYLCMHGGISPHLKLISDIEKINRFVEPPLSGFLCDLLWSDPLDDKDARKMKFEKNTARECSVKFGLEPVKEVLKKNNYISIIRAHQVQVDGYKMHRWGGATAFPSVITVFSAPNYCGEYHNKGAVILIENEKMNIKQYKDVDHPFFLPGNIDLFKWSIPFLMDKVSEIIKSINKRGSTPFTPTSQKQLEEMDFHKMLEQQAIKFKKPLTPQEQAKVTRNRRLRAKVSSFARFARLLKLLR